MAACAAGRAGRLPPAADDSQGHPVHAAGGRDGAGEHRRPPAALRTPRSVVRGAPFQIVTWPVAVAGDTVNIIASDIEAIERPAPTGPQPTQPISDLLAQAERMAMPCPTISTRRPPHQPAPGRASRARFPVVGTSERACYDRRSVFACVTGASTMIRVTANEASEKLSELVDAALRGEEVLITTDSNGNERVLKLVALPGSINGRLLVVSRSMAVPKG